MNNKEKMNEYKNEKEEGNKIVEKEKKKIYQKKRSDES